MMSVDRSVARAVRATIPGEPGKPIVGKTFDMLRDPVEVGVELYRRHGPVCWTNSLGMTIVFIAGPDALRAVFTDTTSSYSNAEGWEIFIDQFFHRGLMLLDFQEHKVHRGVMQAAFKRPAMERYFARMQPVIRRGVYGFPTNRTMHVAPRLKQLTLDVATEIFMDERLGTEADRVNRAFIDAVRAGTALVRHPVPYGRWKKGLDGRGVLEDFFRSRIAQKRARPGDDLFSRLCEATDSDGNRFTDEDVVNHMIFLMMAAHDTSTITLTSMFYQLAKHPEWQERVREEVRSVPNGELGIDDFDRMPTLDCVFKESLRMLTPVTHSARRVIRDVELLGHTLPAGTQVSVGMGPTHRLADWWTDPMRFDPDRFAPGREEHRRHPFLFSPFGGGPHKCIGMHFGELEIKSVAHCMLSRYRLSVPRGYEMPIDYTSLPVAGDGLPMTIERL